MRYKSSSVIAAMTAAVLLTAMLWAHVPPATRPATQPGSTDVDRLIRQLGSDSAEDRDAAEKQLVEIGPSAKPALQKAANDNEDPEVRSRAAAAITQMKDQDSNGPSLITMHMSNAPLQDVLKSISTQAHAQIEGPQATARHPAAGVTVSIDADRKPFWEVMADVCGQLNVCPQADVLSRNGMRLVATDRNWMTQSPHQIVGPFWISVATLYRTRSIDLIGQETVDDDMRIRLIVYPEPKLAITQMSELFLKEVTDDAGNSLLPKVQLKLSIRQVHSTRQAGRMVEAKLAYPNQPGKRIAILRGELLAVASQDVQQFEVDDVLGKPKVNNPIAQCDVQASVIRENPDSFRVQVQCIRKGLSDDKWMAMINRMSELTLEDADGHPLTCMNSTMGGANTDSSFSGSAYFTKLPLMNPGGAKTGDPQKLIWKVATSLKPITVPVVFKDLPLP